MRAFVLLVIVCGLVAGTMPSGAVAQNNADCVLNLDLDYHVCRNFDKDEGTNSLTFEVYWIGEDENTAIRAFEALKQQVYAGVASGIDPYPNSKSFGDDRIAFKYDILDGDTDIGADAVFIAFRQGTYIAIWTAMGAEADPLQLFRDYYDDYVQDPGSLDLNAQLNQLMPNADQFPGYTMSYEDVAAAPAFFTCAD